MKAKRTKASQDPEPFSIGKPARLLLCDDQRLIRTRVRELINRAGFIEVVGEAANGREAVRLALDLKPDLVLMDVSMPEMDGFEATRQIATLAPGIRILAFSANLDIECVAMMFAAGAQGFLLKTGDGAELMHAIRKVLQGERFLSSQRGEPLFRCRRD